MLRTSYLLILFIFIHFISFAQDQEYLVTKDMDTLFGKVTRKSGVANPKNTTYAVTSANDSVQVFSPKDVHMVHSLKGADGNADIFVAYDDAFFIKRVLEGKIDVYVTVTSGVYYLSKDGSELESSPMGGVFSREKTHEGIRPLVADQQAILEEFDTLSGSEKNMLYMIDKYNKLFID